MVRQDTPVAGGRAVTPAVVLVAVAGGCGRESPPAITTHLVDLFQPELVENSSRERVARPAPIQWRFEAPSPASLDPSAARAWEAGSGVADLRVREGRLEGRATSDGPVVFLQGKPVPDGVDTLEQVEIRLRVSVGPLDTMPYSNYVGYFYVR